VNEETKLLELEMTRRPMAYPVAAEFAARDARSDSGSFLRRIVFRTRGTNIEAVENRRLYRDTREGAQPTPR
jgi:hypothetical protein